MMRGYGANDVYVIELLYLLLWVLSEPGHMNNALYYDFEVH
jgi:hypothetical protein